MKSLWSKLILQLLPHGENLAKPLYPLSPVPYLWKWHKELTAGDLIGTQWGSMIQGMQSALQTLQCSTNIPIHSSLCKMAFLWFSHCFPLERFSLLSIIMKILPLWAHQLPHLDAFLHRPYPLGLTCLSSSKCRYELVSPTMSLGLTHNLIYFSQ